LAYIVFLIPISWQPNFEDLRYFKLWILIDWLIVVNHHQVANTMWIRKSELVTKAWSLISKDCIITRKKKTNNNFYYLLYFDLKKIKKWKKNSIFLLITPPWVSTKKVSPIGPAVWPAIRNINMNVLFYYIWLSCIWERGWALRA